MPNITFIGSEALVGLLPWEALIDSLESIFCREVIEPIRHHHFIDVPKEPQATLLLMPAWLEGEYLGVKQVTVFPGNNKHNKPALNGSYLLSNAKTGEPLMQLDADILTARRTAAASALASRYLSCEGSNKLLMIGAGRLARALIEAHSVVRPIDSIHIWSRTSNSAEKLVRILQEEGKSASVCTSKDLAKTVSEVDIISCATMATQPIIKGEWLKQGAHLDLVGAFRKDMRETDDTAIVKSAVFVDTRAGALSEAGDITQAIDSGAFHPKDIKAELSELCQMKKSSIVWREELAKNGKTITLFKSVGAAREDLAAAILAYENFSKDQ